MSLLNDFSNIEVSTRANGVCVGGGRGGGYGVAIAAEDHLSGT